MKVIVVYASAGAGHLKCAQAIFGCLKVHQREYQISLIDILEFSSPAYRLIYKFGYGFLIHNFPFLWKILFYLTNGKQKNNFARKLTAYVNYLNTRNFSRFLIREKADYLVSTHFLSSEIIASLKKSQEISSKLITVITDFGVHPFWVSGPTDAYIVASSYSKGQLLSLGVEERIIHDFGIPIKEEFSKAIDREEVCRKLRIKNTFTVLLMTGSFGLGPLEKIAAMLHHKAQVIVVCASNKKLFKRLQDKGLPNVKAYAFVDNTQELMSVSDIIVTKPGGLSIAESLEMDLLPIFIAPIPGQETENIKALHSHGIG